MPWAQREKVFACEKNGAARWEGGEERGKAGKGRPRGASHSLEPLSRMPGRPLPREGIYFKAKISHVEVVIQQGVGFCHLIRK